MCFTHIVLTWVAIFIHEYMSYIHSTIVTFLYFDNILYTFMIYIYQ